MVNRKDLALLFQRPYEPVFSIKNDVMGTVKVELPLNFYTEKYKFLETEIRSHVEDPVDRIVPVKRVSLPNLDFTKAIPWTKPFSLFNSCHSEIAKRLTEIFINAPDVDSLFSIASYAHDRVNPEIYLYCLSVAMQNRSDTQDVPIPSVVASFPYQFINPSVFSEASEISAFVPEELRRHIVIPMSFTASEKEDEQKMAYFREDVGVNLHHCHWHLVYPAKGPEAVVRKDRRGELFYYMHSQIVARYNADRLCNQMSRIHPLDNLREPINEGYFPKISRIAINQNFPPRLPNTKLQDIIRPEDSIMLKVDDLERWIRNITEAIDQGFIINTSGEQIPLDEVHGIDILGNMIETTILSPNLQLYGNLHNMGHTIIGYCHDPENRFLEEFGVMASDATAMRDPVFYRWHLFLNQIFQKHKNTLPEYDTKSQLDYEGITVNSISCKMTQVNTPPNLILTYWQHGQINLSSGLDFQRRGNVFGQFTHLQHAPFTWHIVVNNNSSTPRRGTCRIWMGPRNGEQGMPLTFVDQRLLMIEMDHFTVNLNPGINTIIRRDVDSNLTRDYNSFFGQMGTDERNSCGCGWPQHLLMPKGSHEGYSFDTFVMISNLDKDIVVDEQDSSLKCSDYFAFCGLRNKLYPDRRAMGYPFDRSHAAKTLQDFANLVSNMTVGEINVRFSNSYLALKENQN
ncbi:hypothetical protein DMENIID0001_057440 [Sergentomyia squamirostris]